VKLVTGRDKTSVTKRYTVIDKLINYNISDMTVIVIPVIVIEYRI